MRPAFVALIEAAQRFYGKGKDRIAYAPNAAYVHGPIGATAGGLLGHMAGKGRGAVLGASMGAVSGASVGNMVTSHTRGGLTKSGYKQISRQEYKKRSAAASKHAGGIYNKAKSSGKSDSDAAVAGVTAFSKRYKL